MDLAISAFHALMVIVGPYWQAAWAAAFVVMSFESARPKTPNEPAPERTAFQRLGMLASLALPIMLLFHGFAGFWFAQQEGAVLGLEAMAPLGMLVAVVGVLVLLPGVVGWAIGAGAPALGSRLHALAPYLAVLTFAFTAWVTWENVMLVIDTYLRTRFR